MDAWTCTFGHNVMFSECDFDKSLEQILLMLQRFFCGYFDILKSIWFSNHLGIQQAEFSFVKSSKISKILEKLSIFFSFYFHLLLVVKCFRNAFEQSTTVNGVILHIKRFISYSNIKWLHLDWFSSTNRTIWFMFEKKRQFRCEKRNKGIHVFMLLVHSLAHCV